MRDRKKTSFWVKVVVRTRSAPWLVFFPPGCKTSIAQSSISSILIACSPTASSIGRIRKKTRMFPEIFNFLEFSILLRISAMYQCHWRLFSSISLALCSSLQFFSAVRESDLAPFGVLTNSGNSLSLFVPLRKTSHSIVHMCLYLSR